MKKILPYFSLFLSLSSSIANAQVSKKAVDDFLNDSAVSTGHAGISIYEPATGKYLYNYNAEKNFMPSSNVKLFTLYAGMKYLGDSLKGIEYAENDSVLFLVPTGDPTLLHPDFTDQRVFSFLKNTNKPIFFAPQHYITFAARAYGKGWAWDDYAEDFMPERSAIPIYGNLVSYSFKNRRFSVIPRIAQTDSALSFLNGKNIIVNHYEFRDFHSNNHIGTVPAKQDSFKIPFITSEKLSQQLLSDTLHKPFLKTSKTSSEFLKAKKSFIYSHPVDSLFKPMMYNSDNFFAEQTLLMVSNERIGYMSDQIIIDSLLQNDFKDIPTKPRWVDGSGLSRYNLFSPKDFVYILNKLKDSFGLDRMKRILPGAGKGTLAAYYGDIAGSIFAKTGSMSNNVSLSGYLITKQKRLLLFSVIINNFSGSGKAGRRAIEKLILDIRDRN